MKKFAAHCLAWMILVLVPIVLADGPAGADEPGMIDWKDAGKFIGREVIVQGRIVQTRKLGKITFLNFDAQRTTTAIIRERNYKAFPTPAEELYRDKFVRVRGTISEYRGKPQIEVYRPDQITILEKEAPIPADRAATPLPPAKKREFRGVVTLACYNVENLFDKHDDPYAQDEGTDPKPETQLAKTAETIRALDADIIAMEEVENRGVLEYFVKNRLSDLGYHNIVHVEGNDTRGIDCALITWLPVGEVTSYRHYEFSDGSGGTTRFRRDLLRVQICPPAAPPFDVYVVHLKCCGGADDIRVRRAEAAGLREIMNARLKADPHARFVICGDFNDKWDSEPMKVLRGEGSIELRGFMDDLAQGAVSYHKPPYLSVIDHIVASPAMAKRYVPGTYRVAATGTAEQASDHFPVVIQLDVGAR